MQRSIISQILVLCVTSLILVQRVQAEEKYHPSLREFSDCAGALDKPICYLALYGSHPIRPLIQDKTFWSHPFLLQEIENQYPFHAKIIVNRKRDPFQEATSGPSQKQLEAMNEVLKRDKAGLDPEQTLEPITTLLIGLESKSIYSGQITVPSGAELRIEAYEALSLPGEPPMGPLGRAVSHEVLELALKYWDKELKREVKTYTYFDQDRSRIKLAKVYGALGKEKAVKRLLKRAGLPKEYRLMKEAQYLGDLEKAWSIGMKNFDNPKLRRRSSPLSPVIEQAYETNNLAVIEKFETKLGDSNFIKKLGVTELRLAFEHMNDRQLNSLWLEHINSPKYPKEWFFLQWRKRGQTELFDEQLRNLEATIKPCVDRSICRADLELYFRLLAEENTVIRARDILTQPIQESLLQKHASKSFEPFEADMKYGYGFPSSMDWMIELDTGAGLTVISNILECVENRTDAYAKSKEHRSQNLSAAKKCAEMALEYRNSPKLIEIELERLKTTPANYSPDVARYSLIEVFLEVASKIEGIEPDFSNFLERSALMAASEVPDVKLEHMRSIKELAFRHLVRDGRIEKLED